MFKVDVLMDFTSFGIDGAKGMSVRPEFHRTSDLRVCEAKRGHIRMLGRPRHRNWSHPHGEFADRTVCQRIETVNLHDHQRWRQSFQNSCLKVKSGNRFDRRGNRETKIKDWHSLAINKNSKGLGNYRHPGITGETQAGSHKIGKIAQLDHPQANHSI
jgi:hypothetical protein